MKWSWAALLWLLTYIATIAVVVSGLMYLRSAAIEVYGTRAAQAEWDTWREDAKKMAEQPNPVKRRVPKSVEPPALVLMRDYFAICLGLAVVLSTVLFGTFMMLVRGAMQSRSLTPSATSGGNTPSSTSGPDGVGGLP